MLGRVERKKCSRLSVESVLCVLGMQEGRSSGACLDIPSTVFGVRGLGACKGTRGVELERRGVEG